MIILDTKVLSEIPKLVPSRAVLDWVAAQDASAIFTTTITQAEMLYGVELLPTGKRRTVLQDATERMFQSLAGRILPFDEAAAREFGKISAAVERAGRPMQRLDAMIAAIAKSQGAAIATRDVSDFQYCGLQIVNPWTDPL